MRNEDVANAFVEGRKAKTANLRTDGERLISYSTLIAYRSGEKIILSEEHFSQTTACHIGLVRRAAPTNKLRYSDEFRYGHTTIQGE